MVDIMGFSVIPNFTTPERSRWSFEEYLDDTIGISAALLMAKASFFSLALLGKFCYVFALV